MSRRFVDSILAFDIDFLINRRVSLPSFAESRFDATQFPRALPYLQMTRAERKSETRIDLSFFLFLLFARAARAQLARAKRAVRASSKFQPDRADNPDRVEVGSVSHTKT